MTNKEKSIEEIVEEFDAMFMDERVTIDTETRKVLARKKLWADRGGEPDEAYAWLTQTIQTERQRREEAYADGYKQGKFDAETTAEYGEPQETNKERGVEEIVEEFKRRANAVEVGAGHHQAYTYDTGNLEDLVETTLQTERQKREEMVKDVLDNLPDDVEELTGYGIVYEIKKRVKTIAQKYGIALTQPNNPK